MRRALRAAWLLTPVAIFLAFYWKGLYIWFAQDDFAWLNLNLRLAEGHSLWRLALAPAAQGTIRPLSERLFFIAFYQWFGLDAFPYRVLVYLTQVANLVLVTLIARRLTGSALAATAAAIFWTLNAGVATSLSWTSTYNQILCSFFILSAFLFFLRYIDSGDRRFYAAQWLAFLAGFGALELNVVYPALAALYALFAARRHLVGTLPLFAASAVYAAIHQIIAPKPASGPYALHFQWDIVKTLIDYMKWILGGVRFREIYASTPWSWLGPLATAACGLALAAFLGVKLVQRDWRPAFFGGWILISLAPVLPLRDHFSPYYLTLPAVGLALLGGWALATGWQKGKVWQASSVMLAALYLGVSAAVSQATLAWQLARTQQVRRLVLGVGQAQRLHQEKVILLKDVSNEMFWGSVKDRPFALVGARHVYLAPGSAESIEPHPELAEITEYELPPRPTARLLRANQAVVYDASGRKLRNVTSIFRAFLGPPERLPPAGWIDVGKAWFSDQLGPGWEPIEGGYRWMGARAELTLGAPSRSGQVLYIAGFCPAGLLAQGPLELRITVEGGQPHRTRLARPDAGFEIRIPLAPELMEKKEITVSLEVERTFSPPGQSRRLGLAFGLFAIR